MTSHMALSRGKDAVPYRKSWGKSEKPRQNQNDLIRREDVRCVFGAVAWLYDANV